MVIKQCFLIEGCRCTILTKEGKIMIIELNSNQVGLIFTDNGDDGLGIELAETATDGSGDVGKIGTAKFIASAFATRLHEDPGFGNELLEWMVQRNDRQGSAG